MDFTFYSKLFVPIYFWSVQCSTSNRIPRYFNEEMHSFSVCFYFELFLQTGLELKENLASGAPWAYPYPYPYDPSLGPYAFNG